MNKSVKEILHDFALAMYDMPNSLCCEYCTKEKCKGNNEHKSCVDCISDFWIDKATPKQVITDGGKYSTCDKAQYICPKTAKEMFEKLGYKEIDELMFNKGNEDAYKTVKFSMATHHVLTFAEADSIEYSPPLSVEEIKAINKKIEELGWLDDE